MTTDKCTCRRCRAGEKHREIAVKIVSEHRHPTEAEHAELSRLNEILCGGEGEP